MQRSYLTLWLTTERSFLLSVWHEAELEKLRHSLLHISIKKRSELSLGKSNSYTYVKPARMFKRVLLPAPDGPIMTDNSPDLNCPDTPCRISLLSKTNKYISLSIYHLFSQKQKMSYAYSTFVEHQICVSYFRSYCQSIV